MVEKYARLLQLAAMDTGDDRRSVLRDVARRWPGALREAELVGPVVCAERGRWASAGVEPTSGVRARLWWQDQGAAALPLWHELHCMFADLLRWRRQAARASERAGERQPTDSPRAVLDSFLASLEGVDAQARWRDATIEVFHRSRMSVAGAYTHLAWRCGYDEAQLRDVLFAGHPAGQRRA